LKNDIEKIIKKDHVILNSISETIIQHDEKMRIVWWNKTAKEQFNLKEEDLGQYCHEVLFEKNKPCYFCPVLGAKETMKPKHGEIISKDGRIWDIKGYSILNENNDITGSFEICRDITKAKNGQKALLKHAKHLEFHEKNTPIAVIEWDFDLNIKKWNAAAEKIFEFSYEQMQGNKITDKIPDFFSEEMKKAFEEVWQKKRDFQIVQHPHKINNKEIYCEWYIFSVTDEKNNITGVVSFVNDISRRKDAQNSLNKMKNEMKIMAEYYRKANLEEKKRIARNIHLDLVQIMELINVNIEKLDNEILEFKNTGIDKNLLASKKMIDSAIRSIRKITKVINPAREDDFNLIEEVEKYLRKFQKENQIKCQLEVNSKYMIVESYLAFDMHKIIQIFFIDLINKLIEFHIALTVLIENGYAVIVIKYKGAAYNLQNDEDSKNKCVKIVKQIIHPHRGTLIFTEDDKSKYIRVLIPMMGHDLKN